MADQYELFRKLSSGAHFGRKKLHKPVSPAVCHGETKNIAEVLDFFGNNKQELTEAHENIKSKIIPSDHKRKSFVKKSASKSKKKRKKRKQQDEESEPEDIPAESRPSIFTEQNPHGKKQKENKLSANKLAEKHQEKINLFRHEQHIYVKGADIPDPVETFSQLIERYGFPDYIIHNVQERGYTTPTPIQMQATPLMAHGREVLCCAPTGSGKTAAFILPILHMLKGPKKSGFRAVVVSPTRELAQQIYREFCHLAKGCAFRIHVLTKANASTNTFGAKSSKRFDILVTTPNRLVHLLTQEPPGIELHNVEWLILDEADKLFEEGKDGFREQIATIYQACNKPDIHRGLFSATLSNGIEEWAGLHLDNHVRVTVGIRNSATATVDQELLFVGQESGKLLAVRDIVQKGFTPPVLIFVQSKDRAKELFHELIYDGINVDVIHSDRTQAQRDNIVKSFRTGKIWVLIATELMGRGIDFKGVNLVINYDFPTSAVAYIHRIGRTGRAGRTGKAITFFTEEDTTSLRSIANVIKSSGCDVPDWMLKIKKASRREKKKLEKAPVKRAAIQTATKYDLSKAKRKRTIIEDSKRKHAAEET